MSEAQIAILPAPRRNAPRSVRPAGFRGARLAHLFGICFSGVGGPLKALASFFVAVTHAVYSLFFDSWGRTVSQEEMTDWDFAPAYTTPVFRPYAIALGELALAWNGLHECLGRLFWAVVGRTSHSPLAVWHSIKGDRAQRDMLLAAARSVYGNRLNPNNVKCLEQIEWILKQANKIEDLRNDALHSPLVLLGTRKKGKVVPAHHFGHVRAGKLKDKKILEEFRRFRKIAVLLRNHCIRLDRAISSAAYSSLPDKPRLPNRGETKKSSKRRRQYR